MVSNRGIPMAFLLGGFLDCASTEWYLLKIDVQSAIEHCQGIIYQHRYSIHTA